MLGNGEIEQRYLNKSEQERIKQRSASMRHSTPANYQNMSSADPSAEGEMEEEEEESEEEKYEFEGRLETAQGQLYDFERSANQNLNEEGIDYHDINSKVKTLDTVTLLVIQETLLEDFIIKDKKAQEKKLNNIGEFNNISEEDQKENIDEEEEEKAEDEEEKEEIEDSSNQGGPEERAAKNSLKSVKFDLLMKQILFPFFQIQTRILQKGNVFEIGSIKFLVAATTAHKQGKVTTQTKIRCNMVVSQDSALESVELIPMRRNAISSTRQFMSEVVNPFLESIKPKEIYTHKHAVIELDDVKFLIKYSRPFFGYFNANTRIKIDDHAKALSFIRIAPIWKDERTCKEVNENFDDYEKLIRKRYLDIYFNSGLSRFVEKGETIFIENLEFFVNDCRPKNGYVDYHTRLEIQTGFTQENFKRKQIQADKNFAKRLQSRESHRTQLYQLSQALGGRGEEGQDGAQFDQELLGVARQLGEDISHLRQRLNMVHGHSSKSKRKPASKSLVQSLPERTINKRFLAEKKFDNEEAYIKCLICLEYYVEEETLKTLPCMHYFHKGCIENWFTRGRTCPVCKWDITKQPDSSAFEAEASANAQ